MANNLAALRQILRKERADLRAGDFSHLADFADEKTRLMVEMAGMPAPNARDLRTLFSEAQSNQDYIAAALKGVQAAQARLKSIVAAQKGLTSYTSDGKALLIAGKSSSFERRA
ncbi:MAG: hypothetical protein WBA91_08110 [Paracoccaceae bacterium]